ncbi:Replication termination factor 2 [Saitoella coloradoensis]
MGNDGGSIPKRSELVSANKKPSARDEADRAQAQQEAFWKSCTLSKKTLEDPIVSCALGRLYNKDAILQYLISPETYGDADELVPHITSLKDVVELKFTKAKGEEGNDVWICPVTRKEVKGAGGKFVYLSVCGHVFSDQAISNIEEKVCLECAAAYDSKMDVIVINPVKEADIEAAKERMKILPEKGITHSGKAAKKSKKRKAAAVADPTPVPSADVPEFATKIAAKLKEEGHLNKKPMSAAVKSLYRDKNDKDEGSNWISRGTFNRSVA